MNLPKCVVVYASCYTVSYMHGAPFEFLIINRKSRIVFFLSLLLTQDYASLVIFRNSIAKRERREINLVHVIN